MDTIEYSVCQDCALFIANGDEPEDGTDIPAAIKREVGDRVGHFALGIAATEEDPEGRGEEEFSSQECELCRSTLAGSRHGATLVFDNYIYDVKHLVRDNDGSLCCRCPHCQDVIGIEGDEPSDTHGEQYQCRRCNGWMEVTYDAKLIKRGSDLPPNKGIPG